MDYDNDGTLDFISGSYDPGDVYLFRGLGAGKYAKGLSIVDEGGTPLVHHPEEFIKYQGMKSSSGDSEEATQFRVASFGSWAAPVDWDADNDLDILIGSFDGTVFLRTNIGTRSEPKYSKVSSQVKANDAPIKEDCHANPVVADWDNDGLWDLVVGSGDGSVGWYKNIGTTTDPKFGSRNLLIVPAKYRAAKQKDMGADLPGKFFMQTLGPDDKPVQGARAQICVTDYNRDGKLDLLVGDFSDAEWTKELTAKEQAEFDEVKKEIEALGKELAAVQSKLYGPDAETDEEVKAKSKEEYQQTVSKYMKLDEKRKSFFKDSRPASYIWLYLRTSSEQTSVSAADKKESASPTNTEEAATKDGPVSVDAEVELLADSEAQLTVTFDVRPKWHLYAKAPDVGRQAVSVDCKLPSGIEAIGEWEAPRGDILLTSPGASVYMGQVEFTRKLKISSASSKPRADGVADQTDDRKIEVLISYQVCNEKNCLPPKSLKIEVPVSSK